MYPVQAPLELDALLRLDILSMSPLSWLALLTLAVYWVGAVSLWRAKKRWRFTHTLAFTVGCLAWFAVTGLSMNHYAEDLVWVLLFQQITLLVVVPPLLLIGSPGRLLLQATPRRGWGRPVLRVALSGYRSRLAQVLLHPIVAIIVSVAAFPALYFTDAISWFLALPQGHLLLLTLFLVFGTIGGAPLWALDPLPRSPSYGARIVDAFVEIQIHALFGLMLMTSSSSMFRWFSDEPDAWGIDRATDQGIGGILVWSYGELPLIIILVVTFSKWRKNDLRRAKRREREDDAALDAYNEYLARQQDAER